MPDGLAGGHGDGLAEAPAGARAGDLVVARAWKYDGGGHWVVPGRYLGADAHGDWVFQPAGSLVARPGWGFLAATDAVCLFPRGGAPWVATFHAPDHPSGVSVYIDVSIGVGWRTLQPTGWEVHSIDMDLDVVRSGARGTYLDDEDEFDEHAAAFGYPDPLQERLRAAADALLAGVAAGRAPFDGPTAAEWFAAGRTLSGAGRPG